MIQVKHKAQFGWVGRTQKTAKTECGKRVACSSVAVDVDATCPACRATVDKSIESMLAVADSFVERLGEHKVVDEVRAAANDPRRYQTIYFL